MSAPTSGAGRWAWALGGAGFAGSRGLPGAAGDWKRFTSPLPRLFGIINCDKRLQYP